MVDPVFPVDAQWEYDLYQWMEEMDKKDLWPNKNETPKKKKKKMVTGKRSARWLKQICIKKENFQWKSNNSSEKVTIQWTSSIT